MPACNLILAPVAKHLADVISHRTPNFQAGNYVALMPSHPQIIFLATTQGPRKIIGANQWNVRTVFNSDLFELLAACLQQNKECWANTKARQVQRSNARDSHHLSPPNKLFKLNPPSNPWLCGSYRFRSPCIAQDRTGDRSWFSTIPIRGLVGALTPQWPHYQQTVLINLKALSF
eukprot:162269-Pelagomonas_calceolata.AAC.3